MQSMVSVYARCQEKRGTYRPDTAEFFSLITLDIQEGALRLHKKQY